jgi:hypothetical protein
VLKVWSYHYLAKEDKMDRIERFIKYIKLWYYFFMLLFWVAMMYIIGIKGITKGIGGEYDGMAYPETK